MNSTSLANLSSQPASWSWFDDQQKLKYHEIQTILDVLAYAENIPVRLLDFRALENFPIGQLLSNDPIDQSIAETIVADFCDMTEQLFASESNYQVADLKKKISSLMKFSKSTPHSWIANHEQSMWVTLPSNPLPIHSFFCMYKEWCWFLLVWLWNSRKQIKEASDRNQSLPAFGISEWDYYFHWVDFGGGKDSHILVIGPIYKPAAVGKTKVFSEHGATQIIKKFNLCYDAICEKSLTDRGDEQMMQRMILARLPLFEDDISGRIESVTSVLNYIVEGFKDVEKIYSYLHFYCVTRSYLSIIRLIKEGAITVQPTIKAYFLIQQDVPETSGATLYLCLSASFNPGSTMPDKIKSSWEPLAKPYKEDQYVLVVQDQAIEYSLEKLKAFNKSISKYEDHITGRRRLFHSLGGDILQCWLQEHLGDFLDDDQGASSANTPTKLYEQVCGTILEDMRADLCQLWRYNHFKGKVKRLGSAYRRATYKAAEETLQKQLEEIADENKQDSGVFRCIDENKLLFYVTDDDITNGKGIPCKPFLKEGLTNVETKSGIFTPIFYQDRIFGVMEVSGLEAYQFSWFHQYVLSGVVSILGVYLYQQQLLFSLRKLTEFAFKKKDKENPLRLCQLLSKIFLCQGATILLRHKNHTNEMAYYGSTHAELFTDLPLAADGYALVSVNLGCLANLIAEYIQDGHVYGQVGRLDLSSDIQQRFANLALAEKLAFVVVREVKQGQRLQEDILGIVLLHHDKPWREAGKWQRIIRLISGQLVAVLDILDVLDNQERVDQQLLDHEIRQDVKALGSLPEAIEGSINALTSWSVKQEVKIREARKIYIQQMRSGNVAKKISVAPLAPIKPSDNEWLVRYRDLAESFFDPSGRLYMQDLHNLQQRLGNMKTLSISLMTKTKIYIKLRQGQIQFSLKELFGATPQLNKLAEELDLRNLCNDVLNAKLTDFNSKGIHVDFDRLPAGILLLQVYPQMIRHWISNMFENAAKYASPNSNFSLVFERVQQRGYRLIFENKGAAISEEDSIKLFTRYSRAATVCDQEGEGIGLYLVGHICQILDIKYELDIVAAQKGSFRFIFTIPSKIIKLNNPARHHLRSW
ncbi:MAG: ATP-binding protein [Methylococcales bacterium]|nr:ATP-binding protein [Methylococcales bacterium]